MFGVIKTMGNPYLGGIFVAVFGAVTTFCAAIYMLRRMYRMTWLVRFRYYRLLEELRRNNRLAVNGVDPNEVTMTDDAINELMLATVPPLTNIDRINDDMARGMGTSILRGVYPLATERLRECAGTPGRPAGDRPGAKLKGKP